LAFDDPPIGRCANKQGCQPVGNCCGALGANCEQACCDGQKDVCRADTNGVSRCFGGGGTCPNGYDGMDPACCIAEGQPCQFRDQCCNFNPCIKDDDAGGFVCRAPQCIAAGLACTPGGVGAAACCNGLSCEPDGQGGTICRQPFETPDGGFPDGGDVTPCLPDQVACTTGSQCCSGFCVAGKCVPPTTCVAIGGTCTGTSECCSGLTCNIPAGQANGTCESSGTCSSAGQSCSTTQLCCARMRCVTVTTRLPCAATDPVCFCEEIPA
jgi:hypothetical protein